MCGSTDLCAQKGGINHCKGDAQINTFFQQVLCVCVFLSYSKVFFGGGCFRRIRKEWDKQADNFTVAFYLSALFIFLFRAHMKF